MAGDVFRLTRLQWVMDSSMLMTLANKHRSSVSKMARKYATTTESRFAQHLERDLDAVTAGLTHPWNSGVVEGHINRIKMLKRQMFGRAGFALLRRRVLLS